MARTSSGRPFYVMERIDGTAYRLAEQLAALGPMFSTVRGETQPRAVNNLAVQALIATDAKNKTIVDHAAARSAVTEVTTE
nr:hypothetical protein [Pseudofrankia sp. BMG5.36]